MYNVTWIDSSHFSLSKKVTWGWSFSRVGGEWYNSGVIKMLGKNVENWGQRKFVSLEENVPEEHLFRKLDKAIDFKKNYEFVEKRYCEDNRRPGIYPIVLFKIVLIQHIYSISCLRSTVRRDAALPDAAAERKTVCIMSDKNILYELY